MKLISVITPCYNEEANVEELYEAVKRVFDDLNEYTYEHIFIDNASRDNTVKILKGIAEQDDRVKIIVNARNFGHIKSPYYAIFQAKGDAVIVMAADHQDPPDLVKEFIKKWEEGYKAVVGVKKDSDESPILFAIRSTYYRVLGRLSETELIMDFTGYGLYDRRIVDILKSLEDPYPYFRGLIAEIGLDTAKIEYVQPQRRRGITKNNFYSLYDTAMLGFTSHSKVPLRLAAMFGFLSSALCFLSGLFYFIYKLLYWQSFSVGMGPIVIGLFFVASVQLFFLGIVGEYVGSIHTQVLRRPLVVEKERINF
jgi:glycosyltransferase involved in cell wall biosynthesis